jgi:peptidoglycan/LPS O-acetylase OafA/YrhL
MQNTQIIDNKNENIEILRAIAIVFVMVVHLGFVLVFPSASFSRLTANFDFSIGVDLFFVISGFVITRSFSNSFSSSNATRLSIVVAFWIKRIFRLLPAAFFWLLVVILYYLAIGEFWDGHRLQLRNLIPIAASFTNIFNVYAAYCFANHTAACCCNILYYLCVHYWSLSLEEQFYIIFPLIFVFFKKRLLILLMLILIAVQFFWLRPVWSYGWFFRIDGFCWGILLALLPVTRGNIPGIDRFLNNKTAVLIFSIASILLLPFLSSHVQGIGSQAKTYGVALVAAISAALVFLAGRNEKSFGTWPPYRRLMLYIGSRSYSLYITHLIVYRMVRHLWSVIYGDIQFSDIEKRLANIAIVILSLVIIIVASEITYRIIELKFRLKGRELAKGYVSRR